MQVFWIGGTPERKKGTSIEPKTVSCNRRSSSRPRVSRAACSISWRIQDTKLIQTSWTAMNCIKIQHDQGGKASQRSKRLQTCKAKTGFWAHTPREAPTHQNHRAKNSPTWPLVCLKNWDMSNGKIWKTSLALTTSWNSQTPPISKPQRTKTTKQNTLSRCRMSNAWPFGGVSNSNPSIMEKAAGRTRHRLHAIAGGTQHNVVAACLCQMQHWCPRPPGPRECSYHLGVMGRHGCSYGRPWRNNSTPCTPYPMVLLLS